MPRSLRSLTILFLTLFFLATVVGGVGLYASTRSTLTQLADEQIASVSQLVAPPGAHLTQDALIARIRHLIDQRDTGALGFVLTDRWGRIVIANVRLDRMPGPGFSYLSGDDGIDGLQYGRAYARDIPGGMRLTVLTETEPFSRYFVLRARIYWAVFGSITMVVLLGLLLFHRMIVERMRAMQRTATAIIDGALSQRVPRTGSGDAFDSMASALNRMLDRTQQLMDQITHISGDVAHEMRSPLTRLRARLKLLEQRQDAGALRDEIAGAVSDVDQALALMGAILRVAEIETGKRRANFARINLDALAAEVVETLAPLAEDAGMTLSLNSGGKAPLPMTGDRQLLVQMLVNLIENAIRHARGSTAIVVTIVHAPEMLWVEVRDNGCGMSEADRALALLRFGRAERSRTSPGYGLGLSLVQAIARLHFGGRVELSDAGPGLRVTVTIPRDA